MKLRIVVLGAGFGGLELCTALSENIGDRMDLTLIDQRDSFYFGFSKLDLMFGRRTLDEIIIPYSRLDKEGVTFKQEKITSIEPVAKRVVTDQGIYKADILVIALGADYDMSATPGIEEGVNEYYTLAGAISLSKLIAEFRNGHAVIGVTASLFKCPPAPSEAAMLLNEYLLKKGVRDQCQISIVMPHNIPIPLSPDSSSAVLAAFEERNIRMISNTSVTALDTEQKIAMLSDGSQLSYDLFMGVPKHIAPQVVLESGMTEDGWIHVEQNTMKTKYPGVYAIGDVTKVGTPKAGVFAEGAAKIAASSIVSDLDCNEHILLYQGEGSCYIDFGHEMVGRVDIDFFSGPSPQSKHKPASEKLVADKTLFQNNRIERWFGVTRDIAD